MGSSALRRMALVITDRAYDRHTGQMALSGPAAVRRNTELIRQTYSGELKAD
jgi:hypothetical protein